MNKERGKQQLTPEARTVRLANLDVRDLAHEFEGRVIVNSGAGKAVVIDTAVAFPKKPQPGETEIGSRYTKGIKGISINDLQPLTLWTPPIHGIYQALVAARDGKDLGACVRLYRASSYDGRSRAIKEMPREGDIAEHLELEGNTTYMLRFADNTDILYLDEKKKGVIFVAPPVPESPRTPTDIVVEKIDSDESNDFFGKLLEPASPTP